MKKSKREEIYYLFLKATASHHLMFSIYYEIIKESFCLMENFEGKQHY